MGNIIVIVIASSSLLFITPSTEAKDLPNRFIINGKIGYFLPQLNSEVDEFYGGGRVFSLGGEYNFSPAFSLTLNLDYKKFDFPEKKENWEVARVEEDYLRIIPITFSLIYKIGIGDQQDFLPYIGSGVGVYLTKLKYKVSEIPNPYDWTIGLKRGKFPQIRVSKSNPSYSNSTIGTGFHLLGGFRYRLFLHLFLCGEIKYTSASISKWNDIDVGGITIVGGVNYLF